MQVGTTEGIESFAQPPQRRAGARGGRRQGWGVWLLVGLSVVYLLAAVGPLAGLFTYAPLSDIIAAGALTQIRDTLWLTLRSSAIAVAASVALGLPTALCLARVQFRGKEIMNALVELPIALPPLVMGVALLLTWGRQGSLGRYFDHAGRPLSFTFWAVVIAQFVVASPFFVRITKAALEQVPRSLEEASLTLGRGPLATYLLVSLPLAGRGILSAVLTCWARAMSEFGATILFAGNFPGRTQTMPLAIFTTMQFNMEACIALTLIVLGFSVLTFAIAHLGLRRVGTMSLP